MTSTVDVGWEQQTSTEVRPWGLDFSPAMDVGDVLGDTTAILIDLLTGTDFSSTGLSGDPQVGGTIATQTVLALVPGHNYRLILTANMGGVKETAVGILITCPF